MLIIDNSGIELLQMIVLTFFLWFQQVRFISFIRIGNVFLVLFWLFLLLLRCLLFRFVLIIISLWFFFLRIWWFIIILFLTYWQIFFSTFGQFGFNVFFDVMIIHWGSLLTITAYVKLSIFRSSWKLGLRFINQIIIRKDSLESLIIIPSNFFAIAFHFTCRIKESYFGVLFIQTSSKSFKLIVYELTFFYWAQLGFKFSNIFLVLLGDSFFISNEEFSSYSL